MRHKSSKLSLITFAMNGGLLLMGALDYLQQDKILFGLIELCAALVSLVLVIRLKKAPSRWIPPVALFFDIAVFIMIGWDYSSEGRLYIQYVWYLAAAFSTLALVISLRKAKA